jgi:hypothetical protein
MTGVPMKYFGRDVDFGQGRSTTQGGIDKIRDEPRDEPRAAVACQTPVSTKDALKNLQQLTIGIQP